jgi:hypothetical protein
MGGILALLLFNNIIWIHTLLCTHIPAVGKPSPESRPQTKKIKASLHSASNGRQVGNKQETK